MRRIAFTAVLLLAGNASGQTLYKCVSSAGTSYQQVPCPADSRTVRTIDATPEPPPTAEQLAEHARKAQEGRLESEYLSHLAGTDRTIVGTRRSVYRNAGRVTKRDPERSRCESAKARRERALDKAGLNRTFDILRRLDGDVATACGY